MDSMVDGVQIIQAIENHFKEKDENIFFSLTSEYTMPYVGTGTLDKERLMFELHYDTTTFLLLAGEHIKKDCTGVEPLFMSTCTTGKKLNTTKHWVDIFEFLLYALDKEEHNNNQRKKWH